MIGNRESKAMAAADALSLKKDDLVYITTKVLISAILRAPFGELFSAIVPQPISERRDAWIIRLAESIDILDEQFENFNKEDITKNEQFITRIIKATPIAIRNHQERKLETLNNVIMNFTLDNTADEDLQFIFLDLVDSFSALHMKLLKLFDDQPSEWIEQLSNEVKPKSKAASYLRFDIVKVLKYKFPKFQYNSNLLFYVISDLRFKGMIEFDQRFDYRSDQNLDFTIRGENFYPKTTEFGKKFIKFTKLPNKINEL